MQLITIEFETSLIIDYRGKLMKLRLFQRRNNEVKFGVEISSGVPINREEVYEILQAQKKAKALMVLREFGFVD